MPTVAAWVDSLRATFGADQINAAIVEGMRPGAEFTFYAAEGDVEIGVPNSWARCVVPVVHEESDGSFLGSGQSEQSAREKYLVSGRGRSDRARRFSGGKR